MTKSQHRARACPLAPGGHCHLWDGIELPSPFPSSLSPRNQSQAALQGPGPPSRRQPPLLDLPGLHLSLTGARLGAEEGRVQDGVLQSSFQVHPGFSSGSPTHLPPASTSQPTAGNVSEAQIPGKISGLGSRWDCWGQFLPGSPVTSPARHSHSGYLSRLPGQQPPVWLCNNQVSSPDLSLLI